MKKIDTKPFGEQANEQANKSAKMKINHLNPGASATNSSLSQWCNFDGATIWQLQKAVKPNERYAMSIESISIGRFYGSKTT